MKKKWKKDEEEWIKNGTRKKYHHEMNARNDMVDTDYDYATKWLSAMLCYVVLCCAVLYCTVLYCTVLKCAVSEWVSESWNWMNQWIKNGLTITWLGGSNQYIILTKSSFQSGSFCSTHYNQHERIG